MSPVQAIVASVKEVAAFVATELVMNQRIVHVLTALAKVERHVMQQASASLAVMEPATGTKTVTHVLLIAGLALAQIVLLRQPLVYAPMVLHHALPTMIVQVQLRRCLGLVPKDQGEVSPVFQAQTVPKEKDSLIVLAEGLPKNHQLKVLAVLVLVFLSAVASSLAISTNVPRDSCVETSLRTPTPSTVNLVYQP